MDPRLTILPHFFLYIILPINFVNKIGVGNEIDINKKFILVSQHPVTTEFADSGKQIIETLKEKFPDIKKPVKEDICYATTNRQLAVKEIAPKCDLFFVIGSRNSSNSVRLVEVAKKAGCKNSMLMYFEKEIPIDDLNNSEIKLKKIEM